MADREIISQKSSAMPASSFDSNVVSKSIPNSDGIADSVWQERLNLLKKPRVLISLFLASSALYCFVIGRDRYISVSEFVIQQAVPLNTSSASDICRYRFWHDSLLIFAWIYRSYSSSLSK